MRPRRLARAPAGMVFNEHTDEDGAKVPWLTIADIGRQALAGT